MPELAANTVSLSKLKISCQNCSLAELCLPVGLNSTEVEQLDKLIQRRRRLRRGEHLFESGNQFHSLFAIRSGAMKTAMYTTDGDEQILGFHLPGELLGLDAFDDNHHSCTAVALDDTNVCELPFDRLDNVCSTIPGLHHQMQRLIGRKISQDHSMLLLLGKKSAEERLLTFLLSLSSRFKERGFSAHEFNLSMSRHDIGNYLGLAVETVSRLLSRLQDEGLISVQRRYVQIHDLEKLKGMVPLCDGSVPPPAKRKQSG